MQNLYIALNTKFWVPVPLHTKLWVPVHKTPRYDKLWASVRKAPLYNKPWASVHKTPLQQTLGICTQDPLYNKLWASVNKNPLYNKLWASVHETLYTPNSGRASSRLLRLSVRGTGNKEIFRHQPSINRYSLSVEKISFINEFQHV